MSGPSLHDLRQLASQNPTSQIALDLIVLSGESQSEAGYQRFVSLVDNAIDIAANDMEANPQLLQKQSEDELSNRFIGPLLGMGLTVESKVNGGHVDIFVEHRRIYTWIGEAKIWSGPAYILEGYLQLTTRYASGSSFQTSGGLIIFCRQPRTDLLMQDWADHLIQHRTEASVAKPAKGQTEFVSTYDSERTGRTMSVRHKSVSLYFKPQDRSARGKKGHTGKA
jgi:hypothetical protein